MQVNLKCCYINVESLLGGPDYLESFITIPDVERKMAASVKLVALKLNNQRHQISEQHFLISAKVNASSYTVSYPTLLKERLI